MPTKITKFDKTNLGALRIAMQKALDGVAAEYGISLQMQKINFDAGSFSVTVKAACDAKGDKDKELAQMYATAMGFGDISAPSADGYTVLAFRPRSTSKPWLVEKEGKQYIMADRAIEQRWPGKPVVITEVKNLIEVAPPAVIPAVVR